MALYNANAHDFFFNFKLRRQYIKILVYKKLCLGIFRDLESNTTRYVTTRGQMGPHDTFFKRKISYFLWLRMCTGRHITFRLCSYYVH